MISYDLLLKYFFFRFPLEYFHILYLRFLISAHNNPTFCLTTLPRKWKNFGELNKKAHCARLVGTIEYTFTDKMKHFWGFMCLKEQENETFLVVKFEYQKTQFQTNLMHFSSTQKLKKIIIKSGFFDFLELWVSFKLFQGKLLYRKFNKKMNWYFKDSSKWSQQLWKKCTSY